VKIRFRTAKFLFKSARLPEPIPFM
jgi:hypothetical protein